MGPCFGCHCWLVQQCFLHSPLLDKPAVAPRIQFVITFENCYNAVRLAYVCACHWEE